ncbi:hypothetical protein GOODEAATRI_009930 [Goodea atripinnis]|uniref:Secreted protein n=1 Tax=Goodea atripinnis TaxID=208336 RepID=A0ABV0MGJ3_9TELE
MSFYFSSPVLLFLCFTSHPYTALPGFRNSVHKFLSLYHRVPAQSGNVCQSMKLDFVLFQVWKRGEKYNGLERFSRLYYFYHFLNVLHLSIHAFIHPPTHQFIQTSNY